MWGLSMQIFIDFGKERRGKWDNTKDKDIINQSSTSLLWGTSYKQNTDAKVGTLVITSNH